MVISRFALGALVLAGSFAFSSAATAACQGRPSTSGGEAVDVPFRNLGNVGGRMHWIDEAGNWVPYSYIQPGSSMIQPTFMGHSWVFKSDDGTCSSNTIVDNISAGGVNYAINVAVVEPQQQAAQPGPQVVRPGSTSFGLEGPEQPAPDRFGRQSFNFESPGEANGQQPAPQHQQQSAPQQGLPGLNIQIDLGGFATAMVTTDARVREGPGKGFDQVNSLRAGAQVQVQCDRSWCQLLNGGWVSKSLLSLNGGGGIRVTLPQIIPESQGQPPQQQLAAAEDFNGKWRATDPLLEFDLIIAQNGQTLSGLGTFGSTGRDSVNGQMKLTGRVRDLEASITGHMVIETSSLPFVGHLRIESDVLVMDAKVTGAGADPNAAPTRTTFVRAN